MTQQTDTGTKPTQQQLALLKTFHAEFVNITPGKGRFPKSFLMGSDAGRSNEKPPHEVTLNYDFQIAKYEVPQNLWEAVMGTNPSRWKGPRNSVEMLSFKEAEEFCKRITLLMRAAGLIKNQASIRLPTEAEWEYVARAGTKTRYSFGDDPNELTDYGWFNGNAAGNDPPVGAKKPNAWGLYDIHGYLWEWCRDHPHETYMGAPSDGSAWHEKGVAAQRVLRGGSWKDGSPLCTSTHRRFTDEKTRDDAVGLRCVLIVAKKR